MSGSPMDPKRLAQMRESIARGDGGRLVEQAQLLDDRDHWEAEAMLEKECRIETFAALEAERARAQRYRSRCPVTAEDAKRAGVTWDQCYAVFMRGFPTHRAFLAGLLGAGCTSEEAANPDFPLPTPDDPWEPIAVCVNYLGMFTPGDHWDILDEMAKGGAAR